MFQILTQTIEPELSNACTPLPFWIHFWFCIAATVIYFAQAMRKKSSHYIFMMFAFDLTFVTQFSTSKLTITLLFITEIILLALSFWISHKRNKKLKADNKSEDK